MFSLLLQRKLKGFQGNSRKLLKTQGTYGVSRGFNRSIRLQYIFPNQIIIWSQKKIQRNLRILKEAQGKSRKLLNSMKTQGIG